MSSTALAQRQHAPTSEGGVSERPMKDEDGIRGNDLIVAAGLAVASFIINGIALNAMEFFRHTEADRVLIAHGMLSAESFLVPQLLESEILTKPPFFYWLIALSISLFGSLEEWVGRAPSVLLGGLYVGGQFLLLRYSGLRMLRAQLAAVVLGTSLLFLDLGAAAEIDMTYGALCGLSLSAFYLSIRRTAFVWPVLTYVLAACAFLTKGPPIVFFIAAAGVSFLAIAFARGVSINFANLVLRQVVGIVVFLLLTGLWLFALASAVGWDVLQTQYQVEIYERVFLPSSRGRGVFFYPTSLIVGMAPWSILGIVSLLVFASRRAFSLSANRDEKEVFLFHAAVALCGVVLLSIAEGKTSRYLFPLYGSIAVCVSMLVYELRNTWGEKLLNAFVTYAAWPVIIALLVLPFFIPLEGVVTSRFALGAAAIAAAIFVLWWVHSPERRRETIACLCLVLFSLRFLEMGMFAPHRNETRGIRPVVAEIAELIPKDEPLYVIEMFERWLAYYLIRDGFRVARLTPALAGELANSDAQTALILLSEEEEFWRLDEMRHFAEEVSVVRTFEAPKSRFLLLRVPVSMLPELRLREVFPTTPSSPIALDTFQS